MVFSFDPHQTRDAVKRIEAMFPMETDRAPAGLAALFQLLGQIDLKDIILWSQKLEERELDLLCHYYNQAPGPRILAAIFLILASRKDERAGGPLRRMFFTNPNADLLNWISHNWSSFDANLPGVFQDAWIHEYFRDGRDDGPLAHGIRTIEAHTPLGHLFSQQTMGLPLSYQLMEHLFDQGGPALERIPPETANLMVNDYLQRGRDDRIQTFLKFYPQQHWQPEFMEKVYRMKGPPDARREFYMVFDRGHLWGIRRKLFAGRMAPLVTESSRHALWSRWIHLCQDWKINSGRMDAVIRPFFVVEVKDKTRVFAESDRKRLILELPHDDFWEQKMDELLEESRRIS